MVDAGVDCKQLGRLDGIVDVGLDGEGERGLALGTPIHGHDEGIRGVRQLDISEDV